MPLFVCEECRHIENTALACFWLRGQEADTRALCTACRSGTWHGRFERMVYDGTQQVEWLDGEWVLP